MMTQHTNDPGPQQATSWTQSVDDRRESPRLPLPLLMADEGEGLEGDVSLGGIGWRGRERALGTRIELLLALPGEGVERRLSVEVFRVTPSHDQFRHQARFVDLPLDTDLAIARWLHEVTQPLHG